MEHFRRNFTAVERGAVRRISTKMRFFLVAIVGVLIFAAGCAQNDALPVEEEGSAQFVLPASGASYHARYTVEEGGPMEKEAWRAPGKMRTDLSVQGVRALSFYFVENRAYSCSFLSKPPSCYDVTATLSQSDASRIVPDEDDYRGLAQVESIKIGNTDGRCYETAVIGVGERKICFAVGGVVAYDSYNVSKTVIRTEYLTSLELYSQGEGPDETVFSLPAEPVSAPITQAPPVEEGFSDLPY